ncbi:Cytoglobin-1 [Acipenser ruthenus]|uniref:Cytoglobin-1 n=1 Tax=Acipenser ruthenus TaxID=7906 RepID=A0A444V3F3_ACIRT|nr:Cytoglobin-1 [Acipenser ruthenus]
MGCAVSGPGLASKSSEDPNEEEASAATLTDHQIELIKESWKLIQEDIAKVGIIMFVRLFETHPECKDVFFLFRDVDDLQRLRTSKELRAHGLRVMSFIEKSVARIDQTERLVQLAMELGKSHYRYNAPPKYYGALFTYVTRIMKQGYQEEERNKQTNTVASSKERLEKRPNAL